MANPDAVERLAALARELHAQFEETRDEQTRALAMLLLSACGAIWTGQTRLLIRVASELTSKGAAGLSALLN